MTFRLVPTDHPDLTERVLYRAAWREKYLGRQYVTDFVMPDFDCNFDDLTNLGNIIGGKPTCSGLMLVSLTVWLDSTAREGLLMLAVSRLPGRMTLLQFRVASITRLLPARLATLIPGITSRRP